MSVINKMLKDLEQRKDSSEQEEYSAVYQAPEKSRVKFLVVALFLVIIGLIVTVSLLLLKQPNQASTIDSTKQLNQAEEPKKEPRPTIKINPLKTKKQQVASEPAKLISDNSEIKEVLEQEKPMVPVVVKPKASEKTVIKAKPKNTTNTAKKANTRKTQAQKAPAKESKPAGFSIVKSSVQYSPEQRLELLMKKAQESFDKGYVSEAIEKLEKVLSISDGHIKARNLLAVAWYGRAELQRAVSILNDGLSKYPTVELWRMTAAKIYFKENNIKGAFSYLDIELTDGSIEFYSMKASVARNLSLFDSAESAYFMLTKLQPDVGNWWLGHAISLDSQEKFELAINSYKTVLSKGGISNASMTFVKNRIKELEL